MITHRAAHVDHKAHPRRETDSAKVYRRARRKADLRPTLLPRLARMTIEQLRDSIAAVRACNLSNHMEAGQRTHESTVRPGPFGEVHRYGR